MKDEVEYLLYEGEDTSQYGCESQNVFTQGGVTQCLGKDKHVNQLNGSELSISR